MFLKKSCGGRKEKKKKPCPRKCLTTFSQGQISPISVTSLFIIRGESWQPAALNFAPHGEMLILWCPFWNSLWEIFVSCIIQLDILELSPPLGLAPKDQTNAQHSIKPTWQGGERQSFLKQCWRTACSQLALNGWRPVGSQRSISIGKKKKHSAEALWLQNSWSGNMMGWTQRISQISYGVWKPSSSPWEKLEG